MLLCFLPPFLALSFSLAQSEQLLGSSPMLNNPDEPTVVEPLMHAPGALPYAESSSSYFTDYNAQPQHGSIPGFFNLQQPLFRPSGSASTAVNTGFVRDTHFLLTSKNLPYFLHPILQNTSEYQPLQNTFASQAQFAEFPRIGQATTSPAGSPQPNLTLPTNNQSPVPLSSSQPDTASLIIHYEARLSALTQQFEQTMRNAQRQMQFQPVSPQETAARAAQQEHDQKVQQMLFGPQPFMLMREQHNADAGNRSLQSIWPHINLEEASRHLKGALAYDPQSADATLTDFWAWYSVEGPRFGQHENQMATFLLTRMIPPCFTENVLTSYTRLIPRYPLHLVARLYAQEIYSATGKNPIAVAENLKVGRDKVRTQGELYRRVVDLHFCRSDRPPPITFCFDLVIAIGHHQFPEQRSLFMSTVSARYPGLQQAANTVKGLASKIRALDQQNFASQNLPVTPEDCETFANYLLSIAEIEPIVYKQERPDKPDKPDKKEIHQRKPESKDAGPARKRTKMQQLVVKKDCASSPAMTFTASPHSISIYSATPLTKPQEKDPNAQCHIHPDSNHKNSQCMTQHPELRPPPKSNNVKPSSVPKNFPANKQCPVHPEAPHQWQECRKNPANAAKTINHSTQPPAVTQSPPEVVRLPTPTQALPALPGVPETPGVPGASDVTVERTVLSEVSVNSHRTIVPSVLRGRRLLGNLSSEDKAGSVQAVSTEALNQPLLSSLEVTSVTDASIYDLIPFIGSEPVLQLSLTNLLFNVLGDSGAEISLISSRDSFLFPLLHRFILNNPIMCQPFNSQESNISPIDRCTKLTEVIVVKVAFHKYEFSFPFFIFPGEMETPIVGRDFLRHTSLSIHCTENCFKLIKNHVLSHYSPQLLRNMASPALLNCLHSSIHLPANPHNNPASSKWLLPAGSVKCSTIDSYILVPHCTIAVLVQPVNKPLRPAVTYLIGVIPKDSRSSSMVVLTQHIQTNSSFPIDLFEVNILPLQLIEVAKGEMLFWAAPLPQVSLNLSSQCFPVTVEYPLMTSFKPEAFSPSFPLPSDSTDFSINDYSTEEYAEASLEVHTYVVLQENVRFLQPRPGLLIKAGQSAFSDAHLVLTAKALAALPVGVWFQEHPDVLPGIPESDVVIPVPLSTTKPVYIKPRRLNPTLAAEVQSHLQQEIKLGLITPCRSSYASPIVVVKKPDGKLRVCTDLREINKIVIADRYPLPLIEDILTKPAGCQYLTVLDLTMGFQQLYLHPDDRAKLAFITPNGHYQHNRMPYGYINGPAAFQREYDNTLGLLTNFARPYIDDLIVCDSNNHRRHDLKLQTILYNCFRRGLAVHAAKSKILGSEVILLGMKVDSHGVQPHIKDGVFAKLKARHHLTLRHIQQTVGTLLWYRRFIPSFSFIIKPLMDAMKELTSTSSNNQHLDKICQPVISKIESILQQQSLLSHPQPFLPKTIHIVAGNSAFATTICQQLPNKAREVLEHWSKVWPLDTKSYSPEERYALAVREILERFRSLLQHSDFILIFTPSVSFTTLAKNTSFWNNRVSKFLFISTTLPVDFRTEPCPELPILNDDSSVPLSFSQKGFVRQDIANFFNIQPAEVDQLPKVYTDGSCISIQKQRFAGYGVFWAEDSTNNLSGPCQHPPFTNNRAELEAILAAVTQAFQLRLTKLLLYSDSQNYVNLLNSLYASYLQGVPIADLPQYRGQSSALANDDLIRLVLQQLKKVRAFFIHIPRCLNEPADALSRLFWATHGPTSSPAEVEKEKPINNDDSDSSLSSDDEALPSSINKILQISSHSIFEERNPFKKMTDSVAFSFPCQKVFAVEPREPGSLPEKGDFALLHDESIALPQVPILDASHYIQLITQMSAAQKADPETASLFNALLTQQPLGLSAAMGNFYPIAFISPESQLIWVRSSEIDRLLVPQSLQLPLTELMHSSPHFGAHCGIAPTIRIIKRLFIWAKMKEQITEYCKQCQVCISTKQARSKSPGLLVPSPLITKTFHRLHVDSIVGLPMTAPPGKFTYVLVLIDAFTKFLIAYPLSSIQAPQIVRCFNNVFTLFGSPLVIVSDNGTEFRNKIVSDFLNSWGVIQRFTTSHNPQANGQAEASVKIIVEKIKTHLRHLASTRQDAKYLKGSWAAILPQLVYSYNITPQSKLGVSPYEMLFGRLPPSLTKEVITESQNWGDLSINYYNKLTDVLSQYHSQAEYKLFRHQQQMKKNYDLHRPSFSLQPGDYVYIGPPYSALLKKLSPTFEGPWKIEKVQRAPGTNEVTGVCVNIGTLARPVFRWFPRYRIRPVGKVNPAIQWEVNQQLMKFHLL